jgi:hypothetical protein
MKQNGKTDRSRGIREDKAVIEGVITAFDWDEDGNVTGIRILTIDEHEYIIENGEVFMGFICKRVRAVGRVREHHDRSMSIQIQKCVIVEEGVDDIPAAAHIG